LRKLLYIISQLEAELSGWLLTLITFLLVINFAARYIGLFVPGLVELTTFVFIATVYLGLAQGEVDDDHIKVSFIYQRVPKTVQRVLYFFNYLLAAIVGCIMAYGAYKSAISSYVTELQNLLDKYDIYATNRGGYIRLSIDFYNTKKQMIKVSEVFEELSKLI